MLLICLKGQKPKTPFTHMGERNMQRETEGTTRRKERIRKIVFLLK